MESLVHKKMPEKILSGICYDICYDFYNFTVNPIPGDRPEIFPPAIST